MYIFTGEPLQTALSTGGSTGAVALSTGTGALSAGRSTGTPTIVDNGIESAVITSATIESVSDSDKETPNKDTETLISSVALRDADSDILDPSVALRDTESDILDPSVVLRDTESDILDPATIAMSMKIALSTAHIP